MHLFKKTILTAAPPAEICVIHSNATTSALFSSFKYGS